MTDKNDSIRAKQQLYEVSLDIYDAVKIAGKIRITDVAMNLGTSVDSVKYIVSLNKKMLFVGIDHLGITWVNRHDGYCTLHKHTKLPNMYPNVCSKCQYIMSNFNKDIESIVDRLRD